MQPEAMNAYSTAFLASTVKRTAVIAAAIACTATAEAQVPTPSISTPPAGTHGFPFMSSALNLSSYGYVEQEFLIAGTAKAGTVSDALYLCVAGEGDGAKLGRRRLPSTQGCGSDRFHRRARRGAVNDSN